MRAGVLHMIRKQSAKVPEWGSPNMPPSKKFQFQKSRVETTLILFFDSKGVIYTTNMYQKVKQRMPCFTFQVSDHLCKRIAREAEMWRDWKFFFFHDNAGSHTAAIVQQFLAKKGVAQLSQPPYSLDLNPLDYFAFPKLKLELKHDHCALIEDIQKSVAAKLRTFPISDFARAMKQLEDRDNECIRVSGDCFE